MGRPLLAEDVVRFVGDIVAIVISDDRATGADAAELVLVDYDPLPAVVRPADAAKDEVLLFPEAGTNVAARSGSPDHDEKLFDGCDVVVSGTLVSQRMAPCPLEPRSAAAELGPDGRLTAWLSTQTPHQDRMVLAGMLGLEPEQVRVIAPGRRRRLRREDAQRRGGAGRLAGAQARPARALDGDAQREHGRAPARPRAAPRLHDRRHARRQGARLPARVAAGLRRVPGARSVPAEPDGADGERRLRDPADRVRGPRGGDEHDADLGLPRRRPARGDAGDRARDRHVRRRARAGPGRGQAAELHLEGRVPAHHRHPCGLRLGRLRGRARPRAPLGRLRRAARRAAAPPRARAAPKQLGIGLSCYVEITNGVAETEFGEVEITRGRRRDRPHRLVLARPGPRDDVRDDRRRAARAAAREGDRPQGRHRRDRQGHRHLRVEVDADRRRGREARGRRRRRAGEAARRRLPRGEPGRHRARPGRRAPARRRRPLVGHLVGRPRLARVGGRTARRAEGGARVPGAPTFPFGAHVAVVEVDTETGAGRAAAADRRRRRRHADQPADRGGAGARRRRDRRRRRRSTRRSSTTRTGTR